jgi:hypothetical protein
MAFDLSAFAPPAAPAARPMTLAAIPGQEEARP